MLPEPEKPTVATHWGTYRARWEGGRLAALDPLAEDPDPSPIANSMIDALTNASRILRPAVRRSFLEKGFSAGGEGRGREPFVEVSWDEALDLAAAELERVRRQHGNGAIYGGSYGWASAGRFHHAQSQIHRFLNVIGGYTRSVQNYSYAAADTIVPHVIGDKSGLVSGHTGWDVIARESGLVVMFGGAPLKNAQVSSGGISRHIVAESVAAAQANGAEIVSVSPIRDDTVGDPAPEWVPIRPNADVALMLGIAHTLAIEGLADRAFLDRHTVGYDRFEAYLLGRTDGVAKDADWAAALADIPADTIRALARRMAGKRTFIMMAWSLQRADHGEQPYFMAITLAAMLGQIGLPGGGFGFGYASVNGIGNTVPAMSWPSLPQGENPVSDFIPVARIADMLLSPGGAYDFNGQSRTYPDIRLVYWAGGNPFHHHQDLNRLRRAWRRPEAIIVHESWWNPLARHADIVFPATTALERNDITAASRDRFVAASHRVAEPAGEARDDFAIFTGLAERLGAGEAFTDGRDEEGWLRHLYGLARQRGSAAGLDLPDFDSFWRAGLCLLPAPAKGPVLLDAFRDDPEGNPLPTPSGRIELFSATIDGFGYDDCPGHAAWLAPHEWLGSAAASDFPLHLLSNQPRTRLHSQYDSGSHSRAHKVRGREPIRIHPDDAAARGIAEGDIVRVFNARGACLAAAHLSDALRPGVVQLSTGAWYDPVDPSAPDSLDKHGNPNVLTRDQGTSRLAQGPSAQSCLVEIEPFRGEPPEITAFDPPAFAAHPSHPDTERQR
ncbi:molybdopterin-dependent oxidoreductase [Afifella sp. IM 167]|uniref:molybdopterin-dependent oxidoreductase n=1 Tax=Afifella sp. IM 167 TaxID=2033586 RepID=UPI001CCE931B|nr:molybdopterin-dependent oxidoreductase [Afifella sp. IM 167]MBZ8135436.1 Asp-tRNA(Asn)/Glu-tRNA(Gln) amidotransferase GatCAB subunit C [Afifella sp. IM 167]